MVKWDNWHDNFNLWEPESTLAKCRALIDDYWRRRQQTATSEPPATPKKNKTPTKNTPTRKSARLSLTSKTRIYSEDEDNENVEEPTTKTPPRVSTEQLIRDALDAQGLVGKDVGGQGDCLYRCISDQLFGVPDVRYIVII